MHMSELSDRIPIDWDLLSERGLKATDEIPKGIYIKIAGKYISDINDPIEKEAKPKLETCPLCGENTVITRSCAKVKYCNDDSCFYWEHL